MSASLSRPGRTSPTNLLKQVVAAAANGYILMFFSEQLFWARFRPGDNLPEWVLGWIVYSLAGYVMLALLAWVRARSFWSIFLAGAVFGWLVEGVFVQTTYEALPLSISWTALAWHALLSVGVGWLAVRHALRHSFIASGLWAAAIGLGYGLWAICWWLEPDGGVALPLDFAVFTATATGLWIVAHALFTWAEPALQRPSRLLTAISAGSLALWFAFVAVPTVPIAMGVLPILLGLAGLGLWGHRRMNAAPTPLSSAGRIRQLRYLALLALPVTATLVYTLAYAVDLRVQTNWVVYLITTSLGFVLFVLAGLRGWPRRSRPMGTDPRLDSLMKETSR
ncbi:MAG: hypothetical protein JNL73_25035 [Anaerolineales bacterium]|nr:hypothetical protein [Anaerolineales bacterium]